MAALRVDVVDVDMLVLRVDVLVLRVETLVLRVDMLVLRVDVVDVYELRVAHVVGNSLVFLKLSATRFDPLPTETSNLTFMLSSRYIFKG